MDGSVLRITKNNLISLFCSYKMLLIVVVGCILPLNTIYQLRYIGHWNDATIFDGLLYEFGLYTIHYLILVPLFIFMVYDIVKPSLMDNFIFFRITDRKKLFLSKMLSCVFATFVILLVLTIVSTIILAFNFRVVPYWSDSLLLTQSLRTELLNPSLVYYSPFLLMVYQFALIFLSLVVSSWLILLLMETVKRKSFALVIMMLINFSVLLLAKGSLADLFFLPCSNTLLVNIDIGKYGILAIMKPIIYWIILGAAIFVCDYQIISRKDFLYEDAPEDES